MSAPHEIESGSGPGSARSYLATHQWDGWAYLRY
jgi:hypothetical protein